MKLVANEIYSLEETMQQKTIQQEPSNFVKSVHSFFRTDIRDGVFSLLIYPRLETISTGKIYSKVEMTRVLIHREIQRKDYETTTKES